MCADEKRARAEDEAEAKRGSGRGEAAGEGSASGGDVEGEAVLGWGRRAKGSADGRIGGWERTWGHASGPDALCGAWAIDGETDVITGGQDRTAVPAGAAQ